MGDWTYYISFMKFQDVADRVSIIKEIHSSDALQDLLQRQLTNRSRKIAEYLTLQPQRFFNAIVVATYGGHPEWHELSVEKAPGLADPPEELEGVLGFLTLDGSEKLWAIDGQHRVSGIKQALKKSPGLSSEEVSVVLVPGVTQQRRIDDPTGFQRTRRLFSTLNHYAKPVGKKDIIALDEDDVVAIVTRRMLDEHPLFQGKTARAGTKSMPPNDRRSFTNIITLYDVLDIILKTPQKWVDYKRFRPEDSEIQKFDERSDEFWDAMIDAFPPLKEIASSAPEDEVSARYRGEFGGHLLFRPIGLALVVRAIRSLRDELGLDEAIQRSSKVQMALDQEPWMRLLWDPVNSRMITAPENQKVAFRLFYHSIGGDLSDLATTASELTSEWAGLIGRDPQEVVLPTPVA